MKDHGGQVIAGNAAAHEDNNLSATVILNPKPDSPVMQEEIFGPILPVFTFSKIDEVIEFINARDKPLTLYYFGGLFNNSNRHRVEKETSSGAYVVNDVLFNLANPDLPFGGVGASGYGKYHGFDGFKAFSNAKAVMIKPTLKMYPYN